MHVRDQVRSLGQHIRLDHLQPHLMDQFDIKLQEVQRPSSLPPVQLLSILEVGKVLMIEIDCCGMTGTLDIVEQDAWSTK